jgi:hypothetical protein
MIQRVNYWLLMGALWKGDYASCTGHECVHYVSQTTIPHGRNDNTSVSLSFFICSPDMQLGAAINWPRLQLIRVESDSKESNHLEMSRKQ